MVLKPGFPQSWDHASINTPDIDFSFKRLENIEIYTINQHFEEKLNIELQIPCHYAGIEYVTINGKTVNWEIAERSIQYPVIKITVPYFEGESKISMKLSNEKLNLSTPCFSIKENNSIYYTTEDEILNLYDPQEILKNSTVEKHKIKSEISGEAGNHTFFVQLQAGMMKWWQPINVLIQPIDKPIHTAFSTVNSILCQPVNIDTFYNESVNNIFENKYLSPRPRYTSLEIPTQGIGEWCHPKETAKIDDSGMRSKIENNFLKTSLGVSFRTPKEGKNIVFTSFWDNYPNEVSVPLNGKATSAYLLMAGTTNHMQTHFINGTVYVNYTDGTCDSLNLINPENWCPIEQDYYVNNKAFKLDAPRPYRLEFKNGLVSNNLEKDLKIEGVYGRSIEDGAGILLDMPLNSSKTLKNIRISTKANDVIIGLMAITLQR